MSRFTILNSFDSNPKGATQVTGFVNRKTMDPNKSSGEIAPHSDSGELSGRDETCPLCGKDPRQRSGGIVHTLAMIDFYS